MAASERTRRALSGAAGLSLLLFLLLPSLLLVPGAGALPIESRIDVGHGVALSAEARRAARALGEANLALDAGDAAAARRAIALAAVEPELADYVAYARARLALLEDDHAAAAALAEAARARHPGSPLASEFSRLQGEALAAAGDEARARAVWTAAIERSTDVDERRALKLAIVESRQRSGELQRVADVDGLIAEAFPESALPGELPPGKRSAKMALLAADALRDAGRGALAIDAYREALGGDLEPTDVTHARMELGQAAFRLRRYEEAHAALGQLLPDPEARYWLARTNARLGRVSKAIAQFEELAQTGPPEVRSRAAYLAGTLHQDRGELERAIALYERVARDFADPERAQEALWRIGWIAYHAGDWEAAQARFEQMLAAETDQIAALRPRYWAARSALHAGERETGHSGLLEIASEYPLSYYGWRSRQRLEAAALAKPTGARAADAEQAEPKSLRATIPPESLRRAALLVEAGLADGALHALEPVKGQARTQLDRIRVGRLLVAAGDYHGANRLVVDAYSIALAQGLREGDEHLWWLSWPPAYRESVEASIVEGSHVEPALVWAIMREESTFRPNVMSSAGARGLLQLMPETAARMARMYDLGELDEEALFVPETNIAVGSAYLDHLAGRFPGRLSAAIGSYNAGPLAVKRWLRGEAATLDDDVWVEDIPYGQTRSYVKRVLRSFYVYSTFY